MRSRERQDAFGLVQEFVSPLQGSELFGFLPRAALRFPWAIILRAFSPQKSALHRATRSCVPEAIPHSCPEKESAQQRVHFAPRAFLPNRPVEKFRRRIAP